MEWFIVFKYLHVVSMFFAIGLALSGEVVLHSVAASRDVRAIRTAVARVKPIAGNVATVLIVVGIGFGLVAALAGQMNLLQGWLVASYIAVGLAFAIGLGISDPWVARLEREAAESPEEAPSEALNAVISDGRARAASWALAALVATIVFLMVVKPI